MFKEIIFKIGEILTLLGNVLASQFDHFVRKILRPAGEFSYL